MIKVLIVDDSALMRRQLSKLFELEGGFEVQFARNGNEAVVENRTFCPDVVTLDINMPEMDGLTALAMMMEERPVPVVMVSSLTEKGALATFEAMALGAIDYVAKPGGTISLSLEKICAELLTKVRAAAKVNRRNIRSVKPLKPVSAPVPAPVNKRQNVGLATGLVVIGVSTGGPRTLEEILPRLPAHFPWPVLVAQHMPASFTLPFANRMNACCSMNVVEADRPMVLEAGTIYIGKGGADMVVSVRNNQLAVLPKPESQQFLWHPSVELLARSAMEHCDPTRIIGVMLTGMGYDGADAFTELRTRGGRTIAESEETAVVFGMPAELIERNGASLILPDYKIGNQLLAWAERN